jgi:U4/U6.U5 tri-snRNP-associated protein 2
MKKKKNSTKENKENKEDLINEKISNEDLSLKEEKQEEEINENNSIKIKTNGNSNKKEKAINIKIKNNENNENTNNQFNLNKTSEYLNLLNSKRQREEFKNEKENQDYLLNKEKENLTYTKNIYCPYLGTIKRHLLDFDFEKVCSNSLSNLNVYACLICGKYYQGCGKKTNAYIHSLQEDHHLFINLNNEKIICLPESYEVLDNSLKDIKANLKPKYSSKEIELLDNDIKNSISNLNLSLNEYESTLDNNNIFSFALDGTEYIPGYIGLNNIKKTDYVNVIIQSLCRVPPLRNYFLNYDDQSTNLVKLILKKF